MINNTQKDLLSIVKAKRVEALEKLKKSQNKANSELAQTLLLETQQQGSLTEPTKLQRHPGAESVVQSQQASKEFNAKNTKKRTQDESTYYEYNLAEMKRGYGGFIVPEHRNNEFFEAKKAALAKLAQTSKSDALKLECDYLLTEGELSDPDLFRVWIKPNPHRSTFSNMILYVREHIESYAIKKWGSFLELDKEFERRLIKKDQLKQEKLKKSLRDLRMRTRTEKWREDRNKKFKVSESHQHVYETVDNGKNSNDEDQSSKSQKCTICGLVVEIEEF
ncbi:hypothetical protein BB561_002617 [Smittium simulii]|uniref:XPA C-terminal domain-containing protein n=1 Tax=Smittium simulii TaxID=133385 RepID=A0A2T9YPT2_9FUNG|nr:hypothetical protein BB561_002617 [Smittium simulii]